MKLCPICQTRIDTDEMDYKCPACGLYQEWWEGDTRHTQVAHHRFECDIADPADMEKYLNSVMRVEQLIWRTASMISAWRQQVYARAIYSIRMMAAALDSTQPMVTPSDAIDAMKHTLRMHNRIEGDTA